MESIIKAVTLLLCLDTGSPQPAIVDIILQDHSAILRWQTQCSTTEVSSILYGCSPTTFQDTNLTSLRHLADRDEPYREKQLSIPDEAFIGDSWKCVFKLIGVQYGNCMTQDGICVAVDVSSFRRPLIGISVICTKPCMMIIFLQIIAFHSDDVKQTVNKHQHSYLGLELVIKADHVIV